MKILGKTTITILSKTGDEISQFEIPGQFLGVDSGEEDLELFHFTWNGNAPEVGMSSVNSKLKGLKKTRGLYALPWHNRIMVQPDYCGRIVGSDPMPLRFLSKFGANSVIISLAIDKKTP